MRWFNVLLKFVCKGNLNTIDINYGEKLALIGCLSVLGYRVTERLEKQSAVKI